MKLLLLLITMAILSSCKPPQEEVEERHIPVSISVLSQDSIVAVRRVTGRVSARQQSDLVSRVSERLQELSVFPGDSVKAGSILARQHGALQTQAVRGAEAAVRAAAAQRESAVDEYNRSAELVRQNARTRVQYDMAKTQRDAAIAAHDQALAALAQAREQFEMTLFRAPFDGVVVAVNHRKNDMVAAGTPLISIISNDGYLAELDIPASEAQLVYTGMPIRARFPSLPGLTISGEISRVDRAISPVRQVLPAEATLFDDEGVLISGLFGEFSLEVESRYDAIVLHELTLLTESRRELDQWGQSVEIRSFYVYVASDGRAVRRPVELGIRSRGFVEILSGLEVGDSVIVAGHTNVRDGSPLRIVSDREE